MSSSRGDTTQENVICVFKKYINFKYLLVFRFNRKTYIDQSPKPQAGSNRKCANFHILCKLDGNVRIFTRKMQENARISKDPYPPG